MAFDDNIRYIGINGEYARDYGPGSGFGGASGNSWDPNAQSNYQSRTGYQDPYGSQSGTGPRQDASRQSAENGQYYYKDIDPATPDENVGSGPDAPGENAGPNPAAPDENAASGAQSGVRFCPKCGTKLEHGEKFCPKCGTKQ